MNQYDKALKAHVAFSGALIQALVVVLKDQPSTPISGVHSFTTECVDALTNNMPAIMEYAEILSKASTGLNRVVDSFNKSANSMANGIEKGRKEQNKR